MGGSKSKSSSTSTSSSTVSTQNLNLDGVEGVTVAGSESVTVNMTENGAFEVVSDALKILESSQVAALETVANTTIGSFEKINESNQSENQAFTDKALTGIAIALAAYTAVKIWGGNG